MKKRVDAVKEWGHEWFEWKIDENGIRSRLDSKKASKGNGLSEWNEIKWEI